MKKNSLSDEDKRINRIIRNRTIISFVVLIGGFTMAVIGWKWLNRQPQDNGQPKPIRTVLRTNEKVNKIFFDKNNIAKEYPKSAAVKEVRVNGNIGMSEDFDPLKWKLLIHRHSDVARDSTFTLDMTDIKKLQKHDIIFDFKCIEGWSQVTHWGGVRFSDFLKKHKLGTRSGKAPDPDNNPEDLYKYVGLMTPDSAYYVGIDMKSMMNPQTILCYEMNEKKLPLDQGYPLRLIITVKYGIKSLKRIGYIYFSDTPPPDFWYEQGYDYDAAL